MLDFNKAIAKLDKATEEVKKAAINLSEDSKEGEKHAKKVLQEQREKLNKMVKIHARHKNLHWREIWRLMYERLRAETGFDAFVVGVSRGISPLDAVCKCGKLNKLAKIAEAF